MKHLTGYRLAHPRKRTRVRRLLKTFNVPKLIDGQDVFMLYANGGYDGTCSGVCLVNNRPHYYANAVYVGARVRLFVIFELSEEEMKAELAYQTRVADLFHYENKYTYIDGKRQSRPNAKIDNSIRTTFYELLKQEFPEHRAAWCLNRGTGPGMMPYLHRHVVGYFEWGTH